MQSLSHVWLFPTTWTTGRQASLSITYSQSLLKLMSIESVMPSNHLILCRPLLLLPSIFPSIKVFPMSQLFASGGQSIGPSASTSVLPMNIQHWRWQEYTESLYKKDLHDPGNHWCDHSPRATHPGMWSQVGLRKHNYEQTWWRWWNSWAISNPERWCCESAALNFPANLKNSAVATGLEKVSFNFNPKERQCQRMFKLLHNCTHLTS